MSHVDDGMLHAYLDGGLSALDAVRVERHVADCAPCKQRLDGARALIQRAARLLEWASPPAERAAPPLAALRPVVEPRWRVPVAWAATIVIALGASIYGGSLLLSGRQGPETALREVNDAAPADRYAAPIVAQPPESTPPRQLATQTQPAPPPAATPAAAESDRAAEPAAAPAPTGAGAVAVRETTAVLNRLADAGAAKARADTALERSQRDSLGALASGARRDRQEAMPSATTERRAMAPASRAAEGAAAEAPVTSTITTDSARILLGTSPVALPDYPVNAIRVRDGVVTVEQVLPPGRVVRLVQRRAAAAEEQERAASELLARYVGGLRVEISGPVPPDSLSRLLERARAIP